MLNPLFRLDTSGKRSVPVLMGWNELGAARKVPPHPHLPPVSPQTSVKYFILVHQKGDRRAQGLALLPVRHWKKDVSESSRGISKNTWLHGKSQQHCPSPAGSQVPAVSRMAPLSPAHEGIESAGSRPGGTVCKCLHTDFWTSLFSFISSQHWRLQPCYLGVIWTSDFIKARRFQAGKVDIGWCRCQSGGNQTVAALQGAAWVTPLPHRRSLSRVLWGQAGVKRHHLRYHRASMHLCLLLWDQMPGEGLTRDTTTSVHYYWEAGKLFQIAPLVVYPVLGTISVSLSKGLSREEND